jgi:hypothetical protein
VPETLVAALDELAAAYDEALRDPAFAAEVDRLLREFVGRPTIMTEAPRLAAHAGGARIWLKREDLAHTGAHKINNTIGQALLAKRMGKRGSSPRPARVSTASRPRPRAPTSDSPARSTWERRTCAASPSTSSACAHGGDRARGDDRLAHAEGRDERGDARLDGRASARRTTSSDPSSVRIPSR